MNIERFAAVVAKNTNSKGNTNFFCRSSAGTHTVYNSGKHTSFDMFQ